MWNHCFSAGCLDCFWHLLLFNYSFSFGSWLLAWLLRMFGVFPSSCPWYGQAVWRVLLVYSTTLGFCVRLEMFNPTHYAALVQRRESRPGRQEEAGFTVLDRLFILCERRRRWSHLELWFLSFGCLQLCFFTFLSLLTCSLLRTPHIISPHSAFSGWLFLHVVCDSVRSGSLLYLPGSTWSFLPTPLAMPLFPTLRWCLCCQMPSLLSSYHNMKGLLQLCWLSPEVFTVPFCAACSSEFPSAHFVCHPSIAQGRCSMLLEQANKSALLRASLLFTDKSGSGRISTSPPSLIEKQESDLQTFPFSPWQHRMHMLSAGFQGFALSVIPIASISWNVNKSFSSGISGRRSQLHSEQSPSSPCNECYLNTSEVLWGWS